MAEGEINPVIKAAQDRTTQAMLKARALSSKLPRQPQREPKRRV